MNVQIDITWIYYAPIRISIFFVVTTPVCGFLHEEWRLGIRDGGVLTAEMRASWLRVSTTNVSRVASVASTAIGAFGLSGRHEGIVSMFGAFQLRRLRRFVSPGNCWVC